jgi:hypothetical protein
VVAGTSVAAARVAAAAVAVRSHLPAARPDDLAAALVGGARRFGPTLWTGAGELRPGAAAAARVLIEPSALALPRQAAGAPVATSRQLTVANPGSTPIAVTLSARLPGASLVFSPPKLALAARERKRVTLTVTAPGRGSMPGFVSGRITASGAGAPVSTVVGVPIGPPPPAHLGPLALVASSGRTDGVRFTAGSLTQRAGVRSVEPLGSLRLQLVDSSGKVVRELTPPGGAPDLLPGEYAYTLTKSARSALAKGSYSFVARGRGPAGGPEAVRKSPSFTLR